MTSRVRFEKIVWLFEGEAKVMRVLRKEFGRFRKETEVLILGRGEVVFFEEEENEKQEQ